EHRTINNFQDHEVKLEKPLLSGFSEPKIVADAIRWTAEKPEQREERQQFLQALVLMQRPRLLATIWSDVVALENDKRGEWHLEKQNWLRNLEKIDLLRRKAGGFIWMHSRSRQMLRDTLRSGNLPEGDPKDVVAVRRLVRQWRPRAEEPR